MIPQSSNFTMVRGVSSFLDSNTSRPFKLLWWIDLIDFYGMYTCLSLLYVWRLKNHVHIIFLFFFFLRSYFILYTAHGPLINEWF